MAPVNVFLYRAPTTNCEIDAIAEWLEPRIEANVTVRDRFLDGVDASDLAESFAKARVLSPYERETGSTMYGILQYEERVIEQPERGGGVLYDGQAVQRALNHRLPAEERSLDHLHLVTLNRVIGTWGEHDGRWHKRIAVLGQPTLLSVPGVWEAPAKPEEYYRAKQGQAMITGDAPPEELLESSVTSDLIRTGDPRVTEILKGYVLAAIEFLETGTGFCKEPSCRLSNPHRHGEMIEAHLSAPYYCPKHRERYGTSAEG